MKTPLYGGIAAAALLAMAGVLHAAQAYPDAAGGWTYVYRGDQLLTGEPALDGTWTHANGSDEFKGDEIGGALHPVNNPDNAPGGASLLTDGDTQYLRIQTTGDPRDYGWPDPSNRKIYFGHYLTQDLPEASTLAILDNGVTLTFRARIPTAAKAGGPIDPLHPDGRIVHCDRGVGHAAELCARRGLVRLQGGFHSAARGTGAAGRDRDAGGWDIVLPGQWGAGHRCRGAHAGQLDQPLRFPDVT